jgi:hypothetical protein
MSFPMRVGRSLGRGAIDRRLSLWDAAHGSGSTFSGQVSTEMELSRRTTYNRVAKPTFRW